MPTENRSSNTEQMVSVQFKRELRYVVFKLSDIKKMPEEDNQAAFELIGQIEQMLTYNDIPERACVVIEEDWPEYEHAWSMIEARVTGRPTSDGFSAGDIADQGAKAFRDGQRVLTELTDDLREILGRPNFTCHFIAKALRLMGQTIAKKSEDEQAAVIHWMLGHYLKHGPDWRQHASDELKAASQAAE